MRAILRRGALAAAGVHALHYADTCRRCSMLTHAGIC